MLLLGWSANAQIYRDDPYYRNDPNYRNNDPYYSNDPYYRNGDYRSRSYGGSVIDRVQADLDRAASTSYLVGRRSQAD